MYGVLLWPNKDNKRNSGKADSRTMSWGEKTNTMVSHEMTTIVAFFVVSVQSQLTRCHRCESSIREVSGSVCQKNEISEQFRVNTHLRFSYAFLTLLTVFTI